MHTYMAFLFSSQSMLSSSNIHALEKLLKHDLVHLYILFTPTLYLLTFPSSPFFLELLPAFEEGELSEALLQPLPPRRQWRPAEAYLFELLSFIIRKETTYENIPVIQLTTLYNIVQHDRTWQKLLENDSPYTVIHGIVQFDIPSLTWVYMDKRRWAQLHCQDMFDPISEWHFCCRVVVQLVWNTIKQ